MRRLKKVFYILLCFFCVSELHAKKSSGSSSSGSKSSSSSSSSSGSSSSSPDFSTMSNGGSKYTVVYTSPNGTCSIPAGAKVVYESGCRIIYENVADDFMGSSSDYLREQEEKLAKLYAQMAQLENECQEIINKLKEIDGKFSAEYESLKSELNRLQGEIDKKHDEAATAYENYLSQRNNFSETQLVGDPVRISNGKYIAEYTDFYASNKITNFIVNRSYSECAASESFGINWICSLDSRIIRCRLEDFDNEISKYKEIASKAGNGIKLCEDFGNAENLNYYSDFKKSKAECEKIIAYLEELNSSNKKIDEYNKYVCYGRYSDRKAYYGYSNQIVFADESGGEYWFSYEANGFWKAVDEITAAKMRIFGIKENGEISNSSECDGFAVFYQNGTKVYYSKYGIPVRKIDRNGNVILFESENGKIKTVQLPYEKLEIVRNSGGQILCISGSVSGTSSFAYENQKLVNVIDNNGIKISFSYDSANSLNKIIKGDGRTIKIEYEISSAFGKKVCSKVIDGNENSESFSYKKSNDETEVIHITYGGITERFLFNNKGLIKYRKKSSGEETFYTFNSYGLTESEKRNGNCSRFFYDKSFNICQRFLENGKSEDFEYNSFGFTTKLTDADGFAKSYFYDSKGNIIEVYFCGNLVSELSYFENGLVKSVLENGCITEYEYNPYGFVTKKIKTDLASKENFKEEWKYDKNNRVIYYKGKNGIETHISYDRKEDVFIQTEIYGSIKKTESKFNGCGNIIEETETDLNSGEVHSKRRIYDNNGNVIRVLLDEEIFSEYEYDADNVLKSYTVWNVNDSCETYEAKTAKQGIRTDYEYNSKHWITKESRSLVNSSVHSSAESQNNGKRNAVKPDSIVLSECFYYETGNGNKTIIQRFGGLNYETTYDSFGRKIKQIHPDGFVKNYSYTTAGRVNQINDSNLKLQLFTYKSDGTYFVKTEIKGKLIEELGFNCHGKIISKIDFRGNKFEWKYSTEGNLIYEKGPDYEKEFEYDFAGREISLKLFDKNGRLLYEKSQLYEDENHRKSIYEGNICSSINEYDCWGRIVKSTSSKGEFYYKYDAAGNCIEITDSKQNKFHFEYDALRNLTEKHIFSSEIKKELYSLQCLYSASGLCLEKNQNGINIASFKYDDSGRTIWSKSSLGAECEFEYGNDGFISSVTCYDSGKTKFSNGGGSIGNIGKIIAITADGTDFQLKSDFSGVNKYSGIERNAIGKITKIKAENSEISYEYDLGGRLTKVSDEINGLYVLYSYDEFGRCNRKYGNSFDFEYKFDSAGNVIFIEEKNSRFYAQFEYDQLNREINRQFSNGVQKHTSYDSAGRKSWTLTKDSIGQIISADFLVYDESGKLKLICNENLNVQKYSYDKAGRLISTEYPYSEEIRKFNLQEAIECGMYIKNEQPDGELLKLSEAELQKLNKLLSDAGIYAKIGSEQYSWKELYEYSAGGRITKTTNPFGEIFYKYDKLNRITGKYSGNSENEGFIYKWSNQNNLELIQNKFFRVKIKYGSNNRPEIIFTENFETGKTTQIQFTYDAFDRRTSVSSNNQTICYLYDGFSFNPVICSSLMKNGAAVEPGNYSVNNAEMFGAENYKGANQTEFAQSNFRTVSNFDTKISRTSNSDQDVKSDSNSEQKKYNSVAATDNTASFENADSVFINFCGKRIGKIFRNSKTANGYSFEILGTDYKENVNAVFDESANCISKNKYDSWGNCIQGEKNISFSNSNGVIKNNIVFYDLNSRDYCPEIRSFTSMDKLKDGANWFSFCLCDPVNYVDFNGAVKNGFSEVQNYDYEVGILSVGIRFSYLDYIDSESSSIIPNEFDCADVSFATNYLACHYAGMENYSSLAEVFSETMEKNNYSEAKATVSSRDFIKTANNSNNSIIQTSSGYDRDYLRNASSSSESRSFSAEKIAEETKNKNDVYKNLSDPEVIKIGTVLAWEKSDTPYGTQGNWTGHTLTVLARTFDENGNVTGFSYIEGHTGGNQTKIGFMNVNGNKIEKDNDGNYSDIDLWRGKFLGTFEISSNVSYNCSNKK